MKARPVDRRSMAPAPVRGAIRRDRHGYALEIWWRFGPSLPEVLEHVSHYATSRAAEESPQGRQFAWRYGGAIGTDVLRVGEVRA